MKTGPIAILLLNLLTLNHAVFSQKTPCVVHNKSQKTIVLSDSSGDLIIRLNYSGGCTLDKIVVNGKEVTGNGNTVYSGVRFGGRLLSSGHAQIPAVRVSGNTVHIDSIRFGDTALTIEENWSFKVDKNDIQWQIDRRYNGNGMIDENDFPCWQFNSMQTWDGALLDNGGVAWNRFLDEGDSYGAHAGTMTCWSKSGNSCLRIEPDEDPAVFRTVTFSHLPGQIFSVVQSSSTEAADMKDGLKRFRKGGGPVFAPVAASRLSNSIHYTLRALTYDREYNRGILKGIDERAVTELLNTIGRYGVVDKDLYGSNGWLTGYTVLQEQWHALSGLAIDEPDFINGFSRALEYERDHAVMPDGRVLPRWHHDASDAMPHTYRKDGFYECMWGYMLDSQPGYAIDVAEQFDMNGDTAWLRRLKLSCEKALAYMIRRDSNGNGLFEVVQDTYKQHKGTDWLDVVWVSYEAASINAEMYRALVLWSGLEGLMGDNQKAVEYRNLALKLKNTFNKDIAHGGFWNPDKKWYAYWREKDDSVYGNNLSTDVNFMAIGYGLCDDSARKAALLDNIERLMQKEQLFIWPSCFFPFEYGVGQNSSFPDYENGDLFLSWAELGTRCYAEDHPEIALRYVQNVINRYKLDGLAYQRYTRTTQSGAGEDILAGNIMAVVGLYRNIYGIRPRYNRLYLDPHLTAALNGTRLKYWLRGRQYLVGLSMDKYSLGADHFSVSASHPFAVNADRNDLEYFNGDEDRFSLKVSGLQPCSIDISDSGKDSMEWEETSGPGGATGTIHYELCNLAAGAMYELTVNGRSVKRYTADRTGTIHFDQPVDKSVLKMKMDRIR